MGNIFPGLIAFHMVASGCHISVAEHVLRVLADKPEKHSAVLWMRMQGYNYSEIGNALNMGRGNVYNMINGPIRRTVYSIIERSTMLAETRAVN